MADELAYLTDDIDDYCQRNVGMKITDDLKVLRIIRDMSMPDFGVGLAVNAAIIMMQQGVPKSVWDEIWQLAELTSVTPG